MIQNIYPKSLCYLGVVLIVFLPLSFGDVFKPYCCISIIIYSYNFLPMGSKCLVKEQKLGLFLLYLLHYLLSYY